MLVTTTNYWRNMLILVLLCQLRVIYITTICGRSFRYSATVRHATQYWTGWNSKKQLEDVVMCVKRRNYNSKRCNLLTSYLTFWRWYWAVLPWTLLDKYSLLITCTETAQVWTIITTLNRYELLWRVASEMGAFAWFYCRAMCVMVFMGDSQMPKQLLVGEERRWREWVKL